MKGAYTSVMQTGLIYTSWWFVRFMPNPESNNISNEGMRALTTMKSVYISMISVSNNSIGDEGVKCIAESKWKNMEIVQIAKNGIGLAGWSCLGTVSWLLLSELVISSNFSIYA